MLIISTISIFASGCKSGNSNWQKYADKELGFTLDYPSDWYVTEKPMSSGSYQDHLSITNYRLVRSYSDKAPHLNYPDGGISIVLHWQYIAGSFPIKSDSSGLGEKIIDNKSLGKRGYVSRMASQIPPPYMSIKTTIKGKALSLELRTDKEGKELGEKIFDRIAKSVKFKK